MHDHQRLRRLDAGRASARDRARRRAQGETTAARRRCGSRRGDQVELALHLVAHRGDRAPGRRTQSVSSVVRVLAAMREPQRDARQPAQQRGRQRALAVDGEDHGGVETAQLFRRRARSTAAAGAPFIQGARQTSTSSTSGSSPRAPHRRATSAGSAGGRSGSRSARIAGVLISTSPSESSRTHSRWAAWFQSAVMGGISVRDGWHQRGPLRSGAMRVGRGAARAPIRFRCRCRAVPCGSRHGGRPRRRRRMSPIIQDWRASRCHARRATASRASATAGIRRVRATAPPGMRTVVEAVERIRATAGSRRSLDRMQRGFREVAPRHAGLVDDHEETVVEPGQRRSAATAPRRSRMRRGSTLYGTSSTSVPSLSRKIARMRSGPGGLAHRQHGELGNHGLLRQRQDEAHGGGHVGRVLQACGSRSGKRSSRKGVRMPPATTAVTLMPCGRSSACSAWLRPSRPHLLAW